MLFGLMGKKTNVGGGTSATLIEKSVTSNGEFEATNDGADGYSKFNVAVPDTRPTDDSKTLYVVYVTKQDGTKVASAIVTFTDTSNNVYTATTDSNGRAQKELVSGTYNISVGNIARFTTPTPQSVVGEASETNYVSLNYVPSSVTYGVKIDLTNSDPETSVTYTDDSIGFTKAYMDFANDTFVDNGWKLRWPFNQIKPCLFKNGEVVKYLNPDDYTKDIDGNAVDITSGVAGDVMIEFPKVYCKLSNDDNYQYIQISDTAQSGFESLANKYQGVTKDKVYMSAYKGYYDNTSLRSLSGKTPSGSATIGSFRTRAQANGEGYQQFTYGLMTMLQCLYCVMFKNLDSQTALGYGWCNSSNVTTTGRDNTKGMYYGTISNGSAKFCGVEDFYGNVYDWVDGLVTDASYNILTIDRDNENCSYNDSGNDYISTSSGISANTSGYTSKIQGTNNTGFTCKSVSGSATTYYCDSATLRSSRVCYFGGYYHSTYAGAFYVRLISTSSITNSYYGGRLAFC